MSLKMVVEFSANTTDSLFPFAVLCDTIVNNARSSFGMRHSSHSFLLKQHHKQIPRSLHSWITRKHKSVHDRTVETDCRPMTIYYCTLAVVDYNKPANPTSSRLSYRSVNKKQQHELLVNNSAKAPICYRQHLSLLIAKIVCIVEVVWVR